MRRFYLWLIGFSLIAGIGQAASIPYTLTWDAPTTYVDGTALPSSEIAYYNLYWGTTSGSYTHTVNNITGTTTTMTFPDNLTTVYIVVTAVANANGNLESSYSNEVSRVIQYPTYTVTPVAMAHTHMSPSTAQTITSGLSTAFTVTVDSGYTLAVSGCGGSLSGSTFTTGLITYNCSVTASATALFVPNQYVQAESGVLSGMSTGVSGADTYIFTASQDTGYAQFVFNITTAGNYKMNARVNSHNSSSSNSYYISVDYGSVQGVAQWAYDMNPVVNTFTWQEVSRRGTSGTSSADQYQPMIWIFTAGTHTFTFYGNEPNSWLDQIQLVSAATTTYSVTPVAGSHSYISPVSAQTVDSGLTTAFTITADAGYTASGTGCSGALVGTTYTTGAINSACTVTASASANSYTIGGTVTGRTSGTLTLQNNGGNNKAITANGTYTFSTSIATGSTYSVTVLIPPSGMSCIVSNGSGTVTSSNITNANVACYWTITPSANTGCNISPSGSTEVLGGSTSQFTFTANEGYSITNGTGTCGGNLAGGIYTSNSITADCTVISNCTAVSPAPSSSLMTVGEGGAITSVGAGSSMVIQ